MKQKNKASTKKMSTILIALAAVFSVACGGLIGALAATMQSVDSEFKVEYSVGNNIAAEVSAKYQIINQNEVSMGSIKFSATDTNGANYDRLTAPNQITLTKDYTSVSFTYTFKNIGEKEFVAVLQDGCAKKNVLVEYSNSSINVPKGETKEVTITISIISMDMSAHYISDEANGLAWTLSAI